MTSAYGPSWGLPCPVCGRPGTVPGPAPCPTCGLPAAGQAALVVGRIGATLDELARERDQLVATLRAAATPPAGAARPLPPLAEPPARPPAVGAPPPGPPPPGVPAPGVPHLPPRRLGPGRRISPQQVLLGVGALLVVAAAIAFVAVAWTRLGLAFQAVVMLVVTAAACGVSAWTARRGLRATEEALAASGAALLAVDLGAAHALGLGGVDGVPLRLWTAASCVLAVGVAAGLGRGTRSTVTWPLVALTAAQPVPLLLLPPGAVTGAAGVAVALAVALLDVLLCLALRPVLAPLALGLGGLWAAGGALGGVVVAWERGPVDSWTATALLTAGGVLATTLLREPRLAARLPAAPVVAGSAAAVAAFGLAGSLAAGGAPGWVAAAALGLCLLTAAVPTARLRGPAAALLAGGTTLAACGALLLADGGRYGLLSLLVLAATAPAALAAVRLPQQRLPAVAAALACPGAAVLLAVADGALTTAAAGLLLALLAATAFGLAALRGGAPEELAAAVTGGLAGICAAGTTALVGAWGQAALTLAVSAAAAGGYALATSRQDVAQASVGVLVLAGWIAVGGAGVQTPEAYTLPAAAGLLLAALPRLRANARSWAGEGPAAVTALVPSALVVVAQPSVLRLVLVVAAAAALTVAGTLLHRQAPFVVGAAALVVVVLGRLSPYAPLVPRWLTLAVVGLLLLVLGATYERRRQQAREAVAWVAQMR